MLIPENTFYVDNLSLLTISYVDISLNYILC